VERSTIYVATAKSAGFFLTDTSFGVIVYANISSTAPDLITGAPKFSLSATLGSKNTLEGMVKKLVFPTIRKDYNYTSHVLPEEGNDFITLNQPLDICNRFPARLMEGEIYFEIEKTSTQTILALSLFID
jgi:hypothetical protein